MIQYMTRFSPGALHHINTEHMLMLRGILCGDDRAADAFREWGKTVDFDAIDYKAQSLMPALYSRMTSLGVSHPLMSRMKSLYSYHFTKTALLVTGMTPVLRAFEKEGVDVLCLKGAGLLCYYAENFCRRSMQDIDILVKPKDAERALEIVTSAGFVPKCNNEQSRLGFAPHSFDCLNSNNQGIDLHIMSMYEYMLPGADDDFWTRSLPGKLNGFCVRCLSPEDNVLHLCVGGVREAITLLTSGLDRLIWIVDVGELIKNTPELSWPQIVSTAEEKGISYPFYCALRIIVRVEPSLVPQSVFSLLRENADFYSYAATNMLDRYAGERSAGLIWEFTRLHERFDRLSSGENPAKSVGLSQSKLRNFPGFLSDTWHTNGFWDSMKYIIKQTAKRLKKKKEKHIYVQD